MIVTQSNFFNVMTELGKEKVLACDTETTGLKAFHGDRLFSVILATPSKAWYFNFQRYENEGRELVLSRDKLKLIFGNLDVKDMTWIFHNAKFDMAMLYVEGIELQGNIWCTKAMARIERNDHFKYSLADCLARIPGAPQKSDAVMEYIKKHNLKTKKTVPGKKTEEEFLHFDRVPFNIIYPYGEADGIGTAALREHQLKSFMWLDEQEFLQVKVGRSLSAVVKNEQRLTKTVFAMEKVGVKIDPIYCNNAIAFEGARIGKAEQEFKSLTGEVFSASSKLFEKIFESEKDKWEYTEKGNPSFESDVLSVFESPAARSILEIRDAKAKQDFYYGFIHHSDGNNIIHPSLVPEGTIHGRFSSNNPNFQNLKADEDATPEEFTVRRAIVPREGFKLVSIDFDQMEYKFALELACRTVGHETELAKLINAGHDFHAATADLVKATAKIELPRKTAKISNFLTLYGGGNAKLAKAVGCTVSEAKQIRLAIIHAAPEINTFIQSCMRSAEAKGYVTNWLGRRSWFSDSRFSYRSPNYIVSGGCADIVKVAMNEIFDLLKFNRSRMIMCVHDELVFEIHESEIDLPKQLLSVMADTYKSKFVPMSCSLSESKKSLGDLE